MGIAAVAAERVAGTLPHIDMGGAATAELFGSQVRKLEAVLPDYISAQRWFAGKQHVIESATLRGAVAIPTAPSASAAQTAGHLALVDVRLAGDAGHDLYAVPIVARSQEASANALAPIARVHSADGDMVLSDGMGDERFVQGLYDVIRGQRELIDDGQRLTGEAGSTFSDASRAATEMRVTPLSVHTSNTNVKLSHDDGTQQVLKLIRRHDAATDPSVPQRALDVWKGTYLTDVAKYEHTPRVFGSIEHATTDGTGRTIGVLSDFVPNDGDSWAHALRSADETLTSATSTHAEAAIAQYGAIARNHGRRLGEMHTAFAGGSAQSQFIAVAPTADDIAVAKLRLRTDADKTIAALQATQPHAAGDLTLDSLATRITQQVDELTNSDASGIATPLIHPHGDFHLGQMLATGDDVKIIDLEGAPALPLAERWQRSPALGDVARQRSSYEYAAAQSIKSIEDAGDVPTAVTQSLANRWASTAKAEFLEGWREATTHQPFVPNADEFDTALRRAELSNVLYETRYELGSRPDWVSIPLRRLEQLTS